MLATVSSASLQGIHAEPVFVEVNANEVGEPKLILVGLPDAAVKESDDRVVSALSNSGFQPPRTRTTINLAPGNLRKEGPCYDLPIALGFLAATHQLSVPALDDWLIAGELSLSGTTRPVRGALAMARLARRLGKRGMLLPARSAEEAALVEGIEVYPVDSLDGAVRFLLGESRINPLRRRAQRGSTPRAVPEDSPDFSEVKGQRALRRAVEVAVAGGHNLLIIGPPGSGKSMVAKRIPSIMQPPTAEEQLEILAIHSAAGRTLTGEAAWDTRPFRSPHHTVSDVALLGGGTLPGPGEISLAHHGVLFLDELPEFKRTVLETLRQPLEEGKVTISRAAGTVTFPAQFMLVAAMNPTPDGKMPAESRSGPREIQSYLGRISGPLLDRIDLHVEVPPVRFTDLDRARPGDSSQQIRKRVEAARKLQRQRLGGKAISCNARFGPREIQQFIPLDTHTQSLLKHALTDLNLSARAYHRVLKVARTIADLAGSEPVTLEHVSEAIQYRSLDRQIWG